MEQNSLDFAKDIVSILDKKLAKDVNLIKISDLTVLADYFVIATGTSSTQVKALSDEVEFLLKQKGIQPRSIEGHASGNWIVLDYNFVVVHVFYTETRDFYDLDRLWSDGEKIDLTGILTPQRAE